MTQLELLAARVRGADNNIAAATIIADWYLLQTRAASCLARESARILRDDSTKFDEPYNGFMQKIASNFSSIEKMLGNEE